MKVLLLNGSPNKNGNTSKMLQIIDEELKKYGVSTEWLDLGKNPVHGIRCFLENTERQL